MLTRVQLHFKLQDGHLVIHEKRDSEIYELLPHTWFEEDFPAELIAEYTHWLQVSPNPDPNFREIEFRPLHDTWSPSLDNWRLSFSTMRLNCSTMRQGNTFMIDVRSATFQMVSDRLKPLEVPSHIHITTGGGVFELSSSLPRYKLSFILNASLELESRNFRDMVVDLDQFTGTMVGLESQLVLKRKNPNLDVSRSRSLIIPYGEVRAQLETGSHQRAKVHIDVGQESSVRYFKYDIDTNLGFLSSTTLLADLYKIYLHALTAFPLPDPLTGRTGTEEALSALGSAKSLSFQSLGRDELNLLYKIADLAPARSWYPEHLNVMQTVRWHQDMRPLGQHWGFYFLVQTILQFNDQLDIFPKKDPTMQTSTSGLPAYNLHLHERAASRYYNLYPNEYAFYTPALSHDKVYPSPNPVHQRNTPSKKAVRLAANVSAMVQNWSRTLPTVSDLWTRIESWRSLSRHLESTLSLSYSREYLSLGLQDLFLPLYEQYRKSGSSTLRFQLTFTLSALSYHSPDLHDILPTLLAFATVPEFSTLDPPEWDAYELQVGTSPDESRLLRLFTANAIPFEKPSSNNLTRRANEKDINFWKRCREHHLSVCSSHARTLVKEIISQWPCSQPSWSGLLNLEPQLINLSPSLKHDVNGLFNNWHRNMHLRGYVKRVQNILDTVRSDLFHTVPSCVMQYHPPTLRSPAPTRHCVQKLNDLLERKPPQILDPLPNPLRHSLPVDTHVEVPEDAGALGLKTLFEEFMYNPQCALRRRYGYALDNSRKSQSRDRVERGILQAIPFSLEQLILYREECAQYFTQTLGLIIKVLSPRAAHPIEDAEWHSGQWPRLTLTLLLSLLSETSKFHLSQKWKSTIVLLAHSVIHYQQAQRLVRYQILKAAEDFSKEHQNHPIPFGSEKYAEWLLIQVCATL